MPKVNAAMTIPGVPESITRAAYIALFEAAGIDPARTSELSFKPDGIHATVFYVNKDGAREADKLGETMLKHTIYIPVEDEA